MIQAINKYHGYFGKDDEGLILLISYMASGVIKNSLYHDGKTMIQSNLYTLIQSGISMNKCKTRKEL